MNINFRRNREELDTTLSPQSFLHFYFPIFIIISYSCMVVLATPLYPGSKLLFLLLNSLVGAYFIQGFNKKSLFFDMFLCVFVFLGFGFKLCGTHLFQELPFPGLASAGYIPNPQYYNLVNEAGENYFDKGLLVSIVALLGLIIFTKIRTYFFSITYDCENNNYSPALNNFYTKNRQTILLLFSVFVFLVISFNIYFGVVQRGLSPTVEILGVRPIFTWLLIFGMASIAAVIAHLEIIIKRGFSITVFLIALLESFLSSVSILSRGMIFNISSILIGAFRITNFLRLRLFFGFVVLVAAFFVLSIFTVTGVREDLHDRQNINTSQAPTSPIRSLASKHTYKYLGISELVIERWVGIEEAIAISNSPKIGWNFLSDALKNKGGDKASFFDREITGRYARVDRKALNFTSIPGFIGFAFYSGSMLLVFLVSGFVVFLGSMAEWFIFKISKCNYILAALIAQVVAYRLIHFGINPTGTFLFFGAVIINGALIYILLNIPYDRIGNHR